MQVLRWLTGIKSLVAVFLSLEESVVLLLLFELIPGDVLLVSSLIDLGAAHVRLSTHIEVLWYEFRRRLRENGLESESIEVEKQLLNCWYVGLRADAMLLVDGGINSQYVIPGSSLHTGIDCTDIRKLFCANYCALGSKVTVCWLRISWSKIHPRQRRGEY